MNQATTSLTRAGMGGAYNSGNLSLYAYAHQNPIKLKDPDGRVVDTIVDVGFILYDIGVLVHDVVTTGGENWKSNTIALGADVAGALVPFATGGGAAYRAGNKLADVAKQADAAVPAGGNAAERGKQVHKQFDKALESRSAGGNISGESAYLGGRYDERYRPKGSSNPDAVLGDIKKPTAAFDLKTGSSGISNKQMDKYNRNLPQGAPVYTVTPKGHDVPRPRTYTGVGAIGNEMSKAANENQ